MTKVKDLIKYENVRDTVSFISGIGGMAMTEIGCLVLANLIPKRGLWKVARVGAHIATVVVGYKVAFLTMDATSDVIDEQKDAWSRLLKADIVFEKHSNEPDYTSYDDSETVIDDEADRQSELTDLLVEMSKSKVLYFNTQEKAKTFFEDVVKDTFSDDGFFTVKELFEKRGMKAPDKAWAWGWDTLSCSIADCGKDNYGIDLGPIVNVAEKYTKFSADI